MEIIHFNNEYLKPLFAKKPSEQKTCLLMGDFNITLLNADTNRSVSELYNILASNVLAPYILQPARLAEKL